MAAHVNSRLTLAVRFNSPDVAGRFCNDFVRVRSGRPVRATTRLSKTYIGRVRTTLESKGGEPTGKPLAPA